MEMHLVHQKDQDWVNSLKIIDATDTDNKILVIGLLFIANGTDPNPTIDKMNFDTLGHITNLNINDLVDLNNGFYHYLGSLTAPGCDETVNWVVIQNVLQITTTQLTNVVNWIDQEYTSGNARDAQPLNNRVIYESQNKFETYNYLSSGWYNSSILAILFILLAIY
jgi:carbonic anhydrase